MSGKGLKAPTSKTKKLVFNRISKKAENIYELDSAINRKLVDKKNPKAAHKFVQARQKSLTNAFLDSTVEYGKPKTPVKKYPNSSSIINAENKMAKLGRRASNLYGHFYEHEMKKDARKAFVKKTMGKVIKGAKTITPAGLVTAIMQPKKVGDATLYGNQGEYKKVK